MPHDPADVLDQAPSIEGPYETVSLEQLTGRGRPPRFIEPTDFVMDEDDPSPERPFYLDIRGVALLTSQLPLVEEDDCALSIVLVAARCTAMQLSILVHENLAFSQRFRVRKKESSQVAVEVLPGPRVEPPSAESLRDRLSPCGDNRSRGFEPIRTTDCLSELPQRGYPLVVHIGHEVHVTALGDPLTAEYCTRTVIPFVDRPEALVCAAPSRNQRRAERIKPLGAERIGDIASSLWPEPVKPGETLRVRI
jgi:hypothetical protein